MRILMVCLPVMNDQISNAARLVELGMGRCVSPFLMKGKKLLAAVQEVWQDEGMRQRAAALQESLCGQQDITALVKRIEAVMEA